MRVKSKVNIPTDKGQRERFAVPVLTLSIICFNFLTTQFLHCVDLSAGSALTLLSQPQPTWSSVSQVRTGSPAERTQLSFLSLFCTSCIVCVRVLFSVPMARSERTFQWGYLLNSQVCFILLWIELHPSMRCIRDIKIICGKSLLWMCIVWQVCQRKSISFASGINRQQCASCGISF
jgi:hypothetical protein